MPPKLKNRAADNWRSLIAIADACGGDWGLRASEAAIAMSGQHADEDLGVTLLQDIRSAFARERVDRISSRDLVAGLIDLDDAPWSEWARPQQQPAAAGRCHRRSWPSSSGPSHTAPLDVARAARPQGKSMKGYYRSQFDAVWRSYCSPPRGRSAPGRLMILKH